MIVEILLVLDIEEIAPDFILDGLGHFLLIHELLHAVILFSSINGQLHDLE